MSLFRKACDASQDIPINEVMDSMQLHMYWLGAFEKISDRFCVFEEVSAVFKRIDDEAFRAEQFKKGWMMKCLQFFVNYYGIAHVEVIYELYKLKVKDTIDEMLAMLGEMPIDIVESCVFPMRSLGLQDWPEDGFKHKYETPRINREGRIDIKLEFKNSHYEKFLYTKFNYRELFCTNTSKKFPK